MNILANELNLPAETSGKAIVEELISLRLYSLHLLIVSLQIVILYVEKKSLKKPGDTLIPLSNDEIFLSSNIPPEEKEGYTHLGYQLISEVKVAVIVLAGGLGTRLEFNHPKGKYGSYSSYFLIFIMNYFLSTNFFRCWPSLTQFVIPIAVHEN